MNVISERVCKNGLLHFIWFIAILLGQFYFYSSGLPQVSHLILASVSVVLIFQNRSRFPTTFAEERAYRLLCIFWFYSAFVNLSFALIEQNISFLIPVAQMSFVIIIAIGTSLSFRRLRGSWIVNSILAALFCCVAFWALGFGRYFAFRYMGFFNDPNQMAFWIILILSIALFIQVKLNAVISFTTLCLILLSFVALTATMSRSGLFGYIFIIIGFLLSLVPRNFNIKRFFALTIIATLIIASGQFLLQNIAKEDNTVLSRATDVDIEYQLDNRGYLRPLNFPEYILFGAGQAMDERFGSSVEIHSSWIGLLFYYGVIGFSLFVTFYWYLLKNLPLPLRVMALAPVLYGMTTYGLRTPIFWVYIGFLIFMNREYGYRVIRNT